MFQVLHIEYASELGYVILSKRWHCSGIHFSRCTIYDGKELTLLGVSKEAHFLEVLELEEEML